MLVVGGVRWAVNPVRPVVQVADVLHQVLTQVKGKSPASHSAEEVKKDREGLAKLNAALDPVLGTFERNIAASVTFGFILYFLALFATAAVSYAFIYSALVGSDPEQFSRLQAGFYDCFVYSVSVLTTSPLGGIEPSSQFAKTIYCCELLSTVALFTMFVSIFSIEYGGQGGSVDAIRSKLAATRKHLAVESITPTGEVIAATARSAPLPAPAPPVPVHPAPPNGTPTPTQGASRPGRRQRKKSQS